MSCGGGLYPLLRSDHHTGLIHAGLIHAGDIEAEDRATLIALSHTFLIFLAHGVVLGWAQANGRWEHTLQPHRADLTFDAVQHRPVVHVLQVEQHQTLVGTVQGFQGFQGLLVTPNGHRPSTGSVEELPVMPEQGRGILYSSQTPSEITW